MDCERGGRERGKGDSRRNYISVVVYLSAWCSHPLAVDRLCEVTVNWIQSNKMIQLFTHHNCKFDFRTQDSRQINSLWGLRWCWQIQCSKIQSSLYEFKTAAKSGFTVQSLEANLSLVFRSFLCISIGLTVRFLWLNSSCDAVCLILVKL